MTGLDSQKGSAPPLECVTYVIRTGKVDQSVEA